MDKDYLSDFSLKCGSWTSSFLYICRAIVTYIILPLAFISLIEGLGPRLGEMTGSEIDFGPILTEFAVYLDRYMFYSIPLLLLAGFIGYYPAGNYARIPFKFLAAVYLSIMLLMFTNGGHLNVTLDGDSLASLGIVKMDFTLSIVGIIYILSIIAFVKGFLAFTEFSDNRKKYLEDLAAKFNDKDEKKDNKRKEKDNMAYDETDDQTVEAAAAEETSVEEPAAEAAEATPAEEVPAEDENTAEDEPVEEAPAEEAAPAAEAVPESTETPAEEAPAEAAEVTEAEAEESEPKKEE